MSEMTARANADGVDGSLTRFVQTGHRPFAGDPKGRAADFAPISYQPFDRLTIHTTDSMTGTSMSTPTTVARATFPNRRKSLSQRPDSEARCATCVRIAG